VNPLAGLAFDLEGTDSHQTMIPAAPSVASQVLADQAVELYWQALCRDVNFMDYPTDLTALVAVCELSKLPTFAGVTPQTLFWGFTAAFAAKAALARVRGGRTIGKCSSANYRIDF
jgi:hypothetical protein